MLQTYLRYFLDDEGARAFPCRGLAAADHALAKAPTTSRGLHDALPGDRIAPDWQWPTTAWGMVLGAGVFAVDVDCPEDWTALVAGRVVPETFAVTTPRGGTHLYFYGANVPDCNGLGGAKIDIRSAMGRYYIIGPGSRTPLGEYMANDMDIAPAPPWLLAALGAGAMDLDLAPEPIPEPEIVLEGGRNSYLVRVAGQEAGRGHDLEGVRVAVLEANSRIPDPLDEDEIDRTVMVSARKFVEREGLVLAGPSAGPSTGPVAPAVGYTELSLTDLKKVVASARRAGDPAAGWLGPILGGKRFAATGEEAWDHVYTLAKVLAAHHPDMSPTWFVAEHLERSLWDFDISSDAVAGLTARFEVCWLAALRSLAKTRQARDDERTEILHQRIYNARYGQSTEPYAETELQAMADWLSVTRPLLFHRLVLCHGSDLWFLALDPDGHPTYRGPFEASVVAHARELLSPFAGVDLEVFSEGSGSYCLMERAELIRQYGFAVSDVQGSFFGATRTEGDILVQRVGVHARVDAIYHSDVQGWLEKIGGTPLLDWISTCDSLQDAAPALWLTGLAGSGKSLLTKGVARLWGSDRPVDGNALHRFNARLLTCPVVEFSERVDMPLDALKDLITGTSVEIERKGRDRTEVRGALRVCVASNNLRALETKGGLTIDDIRAMQDRIVLIQIPEGEPLPKDTAERWLAGPLVQHLRWVVENHAPARSDRLACRPFGGSALEGAILDGNQNLEEAARWVLKAIDTPSMDPSTPPSVFLTGQGLHVSLGLVAELSEEGRRPVSARRLGMALCALGKPSAVRVVFRGARYRYQVWPAEALAGICRAFDADWETVESKAEDRDPAKVDTLN